MPCRGGSCLDGMGGGFSVTIFIWVVLMLCEKVWDGLFESGCSLGPVPRGCFPPCSILPEAGRRRLCCSLKLAGNPKGVGGGLDSGRGESLKDGDVTDVHL